MGAAFTVYIVVGIVFLLLGIYTGIKHYTKND